MKVWFYRWRPLNDSHGEHRENCKVRKPDLKGALIADGSQTLDPSDGISIMQGTQETKRKRMLM